MADLLALLETEMRQAWEAHQADGELIENQTIRDLEAFLGEQRAAISERRYELASDAKRALRRYVASRKTETIETIRNGVFATTSLTSLQTYLNSEVAAAMTNPSDSIQRQVRSQGRTINGAMKSLASDVETKFAQE